MKKTSSSSPVCPHQKNPPETLRLQVRHEAQEMRALLQKQKKVPEASAAESTRFQPQS